MFSVPSFLKTKRRKVLEIMLTFLCSAILFDLDGVLVDSTKAVARAWRRWAEENQVETSKVEAIMHGRRTIEIVRTVAPHLNADAEAKTIERRGAEGDGKDGVTVMPGVAELLALLPMDRWAVVTSGTRLVATSRLKLAGLPVPEVMVPADDVTQGKPHPEPYLKAALLLAVNPAECLVIEDAPAGIQSAHAGGMKAVGITSTFPASALDEADAVITAMSQLRVTVLDGGLRVDI
jgi:mannitol-1-/sugar-/sorbitol-6-phosphatase